MEEASDHSPLLLTSIDNTTHTVTGYHSHEGSILDKSIDDSSKGIEDPSNADDSINNHLLSTRRQMLLMITLLSLSACMTCSNSLLYPFFSPTAKEKGIPDFNIGVVYSAYEITRFIGAPIYSTMVSEYAKHKAFDLCVALVMKFLIMISLLYSAKLDWFPWGVGCGRLLDPVSNCCCTRLSVV